MDKEKQTAVAADENHSTFDRSAALEICDDLSKRIAYLTGQRDGMRSILSMILCTLVIISLFRSFYGTRE